ncbi:MAG TPA: hypothetical protein DCM26_05270 [Desulfotomaculum sp.]|nr:hypothetical protein [Desulfotomaculum sp.]
MSYKWKNRDYEDFSEAAKAWLDWWQVEQSGCLTLVFNLGFVSGGTLDEWKQKALTNIEKYHCGRCGSFMTTTHQSVVNQLLAAIRRV